MMKNRKARTRSRQRKNNILRPRRFGKSLFTNMLEYYMTDKRLDQKKNLKKFMIVFNGFEDVIVEEL